MTIPTLIQLAQLGTIAIGFLGVAVTLRSHRRQMDAKMFIEFSSRFHEVIGSMPVEIWRPGGVDNAALLESAEMTRACLRCFHIIANLFELHKAGYISRDLWRRWERGIRRIMHEPIFRQEWLALEPAYTHLPEFCRYMHALMGEKAGRRNAGSDGRRPRTRKLFVHAGQE